MSPQLAHAEESTADERLLDQARAGDTEAFERLYREHVDSARRLAVILVGRDDADELVAEAFARVLAQLRAGRGPRTNFRSYLHVTIRNGFRDMLRTGRETPASDQPWLLDQDQPPAEELVDDIQTAAAVAALTSLPHSWQQVLWHVEVEGRRPAEVATLLDMRPAAVSSLAYRAREGLRRAYLDQHVGPAPAHDGCRWTRDRLSQYVRGDLGHRAEAKLDHHVQGCDDCGAAFLQLERLNKKLAAYVLPVVLVAAAGSDKVALLLLGAAGATGAAGAAGTTGAAGTSGTPPSGASGSGPVVAGAAVVAAVAALAAGGLALTAGGLALTAGDEEPDGQGRQAAAPGPGPPDDGSAPVPDVPAGDTRPAPHGPEAPAPVADAPTASDDAPAPGRGERPEDTPPPAGEAPPVDPPPTDPPPVDPPLTDPPPVDPPPVDTPADHGLPGRGPHDDGPPGKGPDGNGPPAHGVRDAAPEGKGPKSR